MAGNNFPRIHNAMWPGLVGKGPGSEPYIGLETMLELTANARVGDARFEGVDLFLFESHVDIDSSKDDLARLAEKIAGKELVVGSLVAPVWPNTGGGSAMGTDEERGRFLEQIKKACRIGSILRELGIRTYGIIRIDSASSPADWAEDPTHNTARIAATFRDACDIAADYGERLAAEGEICWGGIHSWKEAVDLLELIDRPQTIGFQADMAHTLLYALGYNAPESRLLPENFDWKDRTKFDSALKTLTSALRPWTIDFHVAQNDATVKGSGLHDKTGHHCLPDDPNGKLNIVEAAGLWMRDEQGKLLKAFRHICWDGCMFPNSVMQRQETWNKILSTMIAVRDAHGWAE
jgi:sugar phosphate isomerase/epimerase